jgi:threonine synthase
MGDIQSGRIPEGSTVVCTLTGHGLKDPDVAISQAGDAVQTVDADYEAVRRAIVDRL